MVCSQCVSGVQMVCRWCAAGVQVMCSRCAGGVQPVCRWYAAGVQPVCSWCAGGMQVACRWCEGGVQLMCRWCASGVQVALFLFLLLTLCLVVPVHLGWAGHCFPCWTPRSAQFHGIDPRRHQVSGPHGVSAWQPMHEVR